MFELFGAYFPAWLFCAAVGLMAALGTRVVLVLTELANTLPLQFFVCSSIGLIVAIGSWRVAFG